MNESYVILTGSKNNAGDFLIKHRAKQLFAKLRPNREIIDLNAWEPLSEESLSIVNSSKALILMGGPALQSQMHPKIYPLRPDLNDITAPITTMGIGWKSARGNWNDSNFYPLTTSTRKLLSRISQSQIPCSVRDYHSLNVLNKNGVKNALMTGCPAYYDAEFIGSQPIHPETYNKVAFSLGVSFISSKKMENAMKSQILELKEYFSPANFEVVFHHSLEREEFLKTHGSSEKHVDKHNKFSQWLSDQGISHVDISGSSEALIDYYSKIDIHIGYRVHAHIFMSSICKPSILIAEDGRGKALRQVIGGLILDADCDFRNSLASTALNRISPNYSQHIPAPDVAQDIINFIEYEKVSDGQRANQSRACIDQTYKIMKRFIESLP